MYVKPAKVLGEFVPTLGDVHAEIEEIFTGLIYVGGRALEIREIHQVNDIVHVVDIVFLKQLVELLVELLADDSMLNTLSQIVLHGDYVANSKVKANRRIINNVRAITKENLHLLLFLFLITIDASSAKQSLSKMF